MKDHTLSVFGTIMYLEDFPNIQLIVAIYIATISRARNYLCVFCCLVLILNVFHSPKIRPGITVFFILMFIF